MVIHFRFNIDVTLLKTFLALVKIRQFGMIFLNYPIYKNQIEQIPIVEIKKKPRICDRLW